MRPASRTRCLALCAAASIVALLTPVQAGEATRTTSAPSTVSVETEGTVVTVRRLNRRFDLAGPDIVGLNPEQRLLLRTEIETTEALGEKGMEGEVRVAAWPLDANPDAATPLFTIAASGSDGRVIDNDVYVVERGVDEFDWQSAYSLASGNKLFDATVPWLRAANGGYWNERRYVALAQVFDDADDAALHDDRAVALLSYVARDRMLDQLVIKAADVERARFLRSVVDQRVKLGWRGKAIKAATADGAMPDPKAGRLAISVAFAPDGATLEIPVRANGFDPKKARLSNGLSLEPFPPNLLLGRWTVSTAKPAPWLASGTDISATVALFMTRLIEVKADRVVSDSPIACANARYDSELVPPPGLFQGGLAELEAARAAEPDMRAAATAKALGLSTGETRSVSLACDTGVYEFHLPEPNLALTAFDNVIFTLSRQP